MKITSEHLFSHRIGDSQMNIFQLTGEDELILTVQEGKSSIVAVTNRDPKGELVLSTDDADSPVSGDCIIIDKVSVKELKTLTEKIKDLLVNQEKKEK